jgi:hypothetical protein
MVSARRKDKLFQGAIIMKEKENARTKTKTVLLTVSIIANILFLLLLLPALFLKTASVSFRRPPDGHMAAAAVAIAPAGGEIVFNAVEISLKKGETAVYQFSVWSGGRQANWLANPLYDRAVVSAVPDGYGISITALSAGETAVQTLAEDGIRDILLVRVTE